MNQQEVTIVVEKVEIYVANKRLPGLNPLTFGEERCRPLHFYGPGSRPYWLLHYVVSGKGLFVADDRTYKVSASQVFITRPGEKIFYQADEHNPWHYIWLAFSSDIEMPSVMYDNVVSAPGLNTIFSDVVNAKNMKNGQAEYLSAKAWEMVSYFCANEKSSVNRVEDYAERAKTCIEADYMNGITVTEIAKLLNLERSYFSTIFKKSVGISPQQYLNEFRLNKAAKLLVSQHFSVSEAAYATGYTDIVNFSRMFKKHFGMSPSEYKKNDTKPVTEIT